MTEKRIILVLLACLATLGVGFLAVNLYVPHEKRHAHTELPTINIGSNPPGGDFLLLDHFNEPVTRANYEGKFMLMFFGFTNCPDVCPTQLTVLENALNKLPRSSVREIAPLFVSLDYYRDSASVLRKYLARFHYAFIGASVPPDLLAGFAKKYKLFYHIEEKDENGDYDIQHSVITYLFNPAGELIAHFTPRTDYNEIADILQSAITKHRHKNTS